MVYRALGRLEEAKELLPRVTGAASGPSDPRMVAVKARSVGLQQLVRRANRLLGEGSLVKAEGLYLQILARVPRHYTALANLGNVYGRQGKVEGRAQDDGDAAQERKCDQACALHGVLLPFRHY